MTCGGGGEVPAQLRAAAAAAAAAASTIPASSAIRAYFSRFHGKALAVSYTGPVPMSKATASAKPALTAAAVPPGQQVLVGKEASTFKEVNRLYECRDFKKALRLCDDILKKVADHGETMALKAMCLHGSGKKEEALELSRRALKANMKSQVTWHVLGTMHRSDMNHREAMRCFLQALKWDKDNLNILRDVATVQVYIHSPPPPPTAPVSLHSPGPHWRT